MIIAAPLGWRNVCPTFYSVIFYYPFKYERVRFVILITFKGSIHTSYSVRAENLWSFCLSSGVLKNSSNPDNHRVSPPEEFWNPESKKNSNPKKWIRKAFKLWSEKIEDNWTICLSSARDEVKFSKTVIAKSNIDLHETSIQLGYRFTNREGVTSHFQQRLTPGIFEIALDFLNNTS